MLSKQYVIAITALFFLMDNSHASDDNLIDTLNKAGTDVVLKATGPIYHIDTAKEIFSRHGFFISDARTTSEDDGLSVWSVTISNANGGSFKVEKTQDVDATKIAIANFILNHLYPQTESAETPES